MVVSPDPQPIAFLGLPRELRDHIIGYLALPHFVYTSSDKPNTANLHRSKLPAHTFVDTRIHLPCRISPHVLGVCRQLREECLQYHSHALNSHSSAAADVRPSQEPPVSNLLAERVGQEVDEEVERLGEHPLRITLEVQRQLRGKFGYAIPVREELSPRFLALLPLMDRARKLRLVIWPGYDWWNGARPQAFTKINGRIKIDANAPPKPDALSVSIGKVLDCLPAVEELQVDVLAHVGDLSRWDLPDSVWTKIQYWLDGPIASEGGHALQKVCRKITGVWSPGCIETLYDQQETRTGDGSKWHIKRHGDMRTPKLVALADPGELDHLNETVDEEFDRTY
ncbi:hypothetical protein BDU57DRAFT_540636 [Ampelomyces quisqualis]|uniref:Uncharacterized protein n=1 Tax=Ampelomyces quisqualis TaxID=50730 RepID=A0A6A5QL04_AMPQU|nr:hypothetical protein BDU57DRAFT_540636 [Ampelomyces quisqualis]